MVIVTFTMDQCIQVDLQGRKLLICIPQVRAHPCISMGVTEKSMVAYIHPTIWKKGGSWPSTLNSKEDGI